MNDTIWVALITGGATALAVTISAIGAAISANKAAYRAEQVRTDLIAHNTRVVNQIQEVHVLVNAQLEAAMDRLRDCQKKLARALAKIDQLQGNPTDEDTHVRF